MTIQFRSRIRSTFDYGTDLKQSGKCCFSDGTSEEITFYECFSRSGTFFVDKETPCPTEADKGFCCACSYLSDSQKQEVINHLPYSTSNGFFSNSTFGIQSNITKCECDRIGGNWSATNSNYTLCRKPVVVDGQTVTVDARIPNACCAFIIQNGSPNGITCQNVCTPRACANLALIQDEDVPAYRNTTFTANKVCSREIVSGIAGVECSNSAFTSKLISNTTAFEGEPMGPCYDLDESTLQYSCSIKPSFLCQGYWIDPTSIDAEIAYCDHPYSPKAPSKTLNYVNPIQYSQDEFDALNLSVGDEFQGGIYIGTFIPKKPNSVQFSTTYGSLNFSTPESTSHSVSDESEYKKWAIIVNKSYLTTPLIYSSDTILNYNSSYYDGYLNCYGDLNKNQAIQSATINTIAGKLRNGFIDYYVPSILEMMFLAQQYKQNTSLSDLLDLSDTFSSSTFVTDKYLRGFPTGENIFSNMVLIYGQSFLDGENYGKTVTFPINRIVNFLLFRRIVIT